jgi:hypothetical protein
VHTSPLPTLLVHSTFPPALPANNRRRLRETGFAIATSRVPSLRRRRASGPSPTCHPTTNPRPSSSTAARSISHLMARDRDDPSVSARQPAAAAERRRRQMIIRSSDNHPRDAADDPGVDYFPRAVRPGPPPPPTARAAATSSTPQRRGFLPTNSHRRAGRGHPAQRISPRRCPYISTRRAPSSSTTTDHHRPQAATPHVLENSPNCPLSSKRKGERESGGEREKDFSFRFLRAATDRPNAPPHQSSTFLAQT